MNIRLGKFTETYVPLDIDQKYTYTTTYVSGSPGQGKSTFLGNLAEQFHAAGEGVLVLDIKGDLARDIASRSHRPEDCIYVKMGEIDFGNRNRRYWTINPFEGHRDSPTRASQVRRSVVQSFERMGLAQLDTMANIRHTLLIATDMAMTLPDPTYLDLYCIIVDQDYRERILHSTPNLDPFTKREWADLKETRGGMSGREQRSIIRTSRNRLYTLLNDWSARLPTTRYDGTLKIRKWLDAGKMVLIDIGLPLQHEVGVDLGNMIMAQVLTEIYQREGTNRDRVWRIVVDEFHQFVGNSFAKIMTDLRSLNAFLVVAHQDRGQLTKPELAELRSAIGHAGLEARFSQSREDRVALASIYGQDAVQDYFELRQFEARVTYFSRLLGNKNTETLMLNDWWRDPVPGQLELLERQAQGMTHHRNTLMERFTSRYAALLDPNAVCDGAETNGNVQPSREAPKKSQVRSQQQEASQASGASDEETDDAPRPGRRRQPRALDQLDGPGSVIPRPPRKK